MIKTQEWTDCDGDTLRLESFGDGEPILRVNDSEAVALRRAAVAQLHAALSNELEQAAPSDAPEADHAECGAVMGDGRGNDWCGHGVQLAEAEPATITAEAEAAVYGDRQADYGHPREDFTRTAVLWQGLLLHKLADGESISPEDVARCMIGVKLARDVHAPKRDNRVDGAGYFLTLDRLETGR